MRISSLIIIVSFQFSTVSAQNVRVVNPPERLPLPSASVATVSPDGSRIAFSGEKFQKLFVADSEGVGIHELCSHAAAGWGHRWSPDGRFIAVRVNHPEQHTKRVGLEILDLETQKEIPVTDILPSRSRLSLPQWDAAHGKAQLSYTTRSGLEFKQIVFDDSTVSVSNVDRQAASFSRWSTDGLEIHAASKVQRVRPFRQPRTVLNSAWSPDRKASAVEFSGRPSFYVIPADGKTPLLIDQKGESPCWLNDRFVVYMVTEDDGYRITSGNIWIADKEGKVKKNLTEGLNEIALYPSAAKNGTIVFTTESGAVYKMKVAVE